MRQHLKACRDSIAHRYHAISRRIGRHYHAAEHHGHLVYCLLVFVEGHSIYAYVAGGLFAWGVLGFLIPVEMHGEHE